MSRWSQLARRRDLGALAPLLVSGLSTALLGSACILPDLEIEFREDEVNQHPVRFVASTPMSVDDQCECELRATGTDACAGVPAGEELPNCPYAPLAAVPQFMPEELNFCSCNPGEKDTRAPGAIDDLFVADQDAVDGNPEDSIFAVALLDLPSNANADPTDYVAYRELVDPRVPLSAVSHDLLFNADILPIPRPRLRQLRIANPDNRFDLCNDGGPGFGPLAPGWHTLTLMVTDREWLTLVNVDTEGNVIDRFVRDGVPDVAAGATWDTRTYVFNCLAADDEACACDSEL
jgi:hypothetical protein